MLFDDERKTNFVRKARDIFAPFSFIFSWKNWNSIAVSVLTLKKSSKIKILLLGFTECASPVNLCKQMLITCQRCSLQCHFLQETVIARRFWSKSSLTETLSSTKIVRLMTLLDRNGLGENFFTLAKNSTVCSHKKIDLDSVLNKKAYLDKRLTIEQNHDQVLTWKLKTYQSPDKYLRLLMPGLCSGFFFKESAKCFIIAYQILQHFFETLLQVFAVLMICLSFHSQKTYFISTFAYCLFKQINGFFWEYCLVSRQLPSSRS